MESRGGIVESEQGRQANNFSNEHPQVTFCLQDQFQITSLSQGLVFGTKSRNKLFRENAKTKQVSWHMLAASN